MKAFSAEDYLEDDCGEGFGLWPGLTSSLQAIPIHHDPDSRAVLSPAATMPRPRAAASHTPPPRL